MADALERVTNLLALLLETQQPLTLEDIANELSSYPPKVAAMRGAFERDKAMLREIGIPIESKVLAGSDAGQTAYWIDRSRYELSGLDLTTEERHALQLAVAAVRSSDARFGLLKLGGATDGEPSVVANVPTLDALPVLREAAASRSIVEFRYHGVDRVIEPYSLLLREGFWYIIGLDHGHGEVRTYRVDRIDGEPRVGAPQSFERPVGFDPRASFPSDPKQLGASGPEGDGPSMATVWIEARRAVLLIDELGVDAVVRRCSDGSVIVEVACANVDAFRSWLFGLGDRATVLGPPDVRASIVDWLRQSAGQVAT